MCLSETASKTLLIVINIAFFLLGLAAMLLGVLMLVEEDQILGLLSRVPLNTDNIENGLYSLSWLENFAYMMLIAGIFLFGVSGAGLCGACCKSQCLIAIYGTLVTLILLVELSAGVIAVLYTSRVEAYLVTFLSEALTKYYIGMQYDTSDGVTLSSDDTGVSDGFDFAQIKFKCCGVNNYTDYAATDLVWPGYYTVEGVNVSAVVPASCCILDDYSVWPDSLDQVSFTNITECITSADPYVTNTEGCYETIKTEILNYGYAFVAIGICVGIFVEVLGLWSAISLYRALNSSKVGAV